MGNDDTRTWSKDFFERRKAMPTMSHAGIPTESIDERHPIGDVEAERVNI
jgi:branched-chain amino acid transport system substrate-binding protein